MRTTNEKSMQLIKSFEGFSSESYPDPCSVLARACHESGISIYRGQYKVIPAWEVMDGKPWTIGYGATHNEDGSPVIPRQTWDEKTAELALEADIWSVAGKYLETQPDIEKLNDDQFGALCSFAYNAGIGSLYKSEMFMAIRLSRSYTTIRDIWAQTNVKRNGTDVPGLIRRRRAEAALFLSDYAGMEAAIKA